jgi:hypothetical protein
MSVEKDGLICAVTAAKPVFEPGERLSFVFTFTNVSQDQYCLYNKLFDYSFANDREFRSCGSFMITNEKRGGLWEIRCNDKVTRESKMIPTMLLKPGQSKSLTFTFQADLQFHPKAMGASQTRLPPGNYQAVVALNFHSYPGSKIRYWDGDLTNAVATFEVAAVGTGENR